MNEKTSADVESVELLPCPFCGGNGQISEWLPPTPFEQPVWKVMCDGSECDVRVVTSSYVSRAAVINAWNRRADTPAGLESAGDEVDRSLAEIAEEVLQCSASWEPQVCLLGNVRAVEISKLAATFLVENEISNLQSQLAAALAERDALKGVLEYVLDCGRGTSGRIIIEEHQENKIKAAIEAQGERDDTNCK